MVLKRIARFYESYETLGLKITLLLISLQVVHLYWLSTTVVIKRLFAENFFAFPQIPTILFVSIDYLEIPALFAGMVFYGLKIYKGEQVKRNALFFALLASQIFHMFWITDDVVYGTLFNTMPVAIPPLLAWAAIFVDYLELPVIGDLFYRLAKKKAL